MGGVVYNAHLLFSVFYTMKVPADYPFDQQFLNEQRSRLEKEKDAMLKQIQNLKRSDSFANPDRVDDNAAIDTDAREQEEHMTTEAEIEELRRIVKDVNVALANIDKGTYGVCEKTGRYIDKKRLQLIPYARYAV